MNRFALHIGINRVNPAHYGGTFPSLRGAVNDAIAMHQLLQPLGYIQQVSLHEGNATIANLRQTLAMFAGQMVAGDLLVVTYSGHGSQIFDPQGIDGQDRLDEVYVLWDRFLLDDELRRLFVGFGHGVHIVVVSDSCNSGTITENLVESSANLETEPALESTLIARDGVDELGSYDRQHPVDDEQSRLVNWQIAMQVVNRNIVVYQPIMLQPPLPESALRATVVSLSACRDDQEALERPDGSHGWFTFHLIDQIVKNGLPPDYPTLRNQLQNLTAPHRQTPQLNIYGPNKPQLANRNPFI